MRVVRKDLQRELILHFIGNLFNFCAMLFFTFRPKRNILALQNVEH